MCPDLNHSNIIPCFYQADDVKSNLLNMEDKITDLQEDHSIPEPLEKQLSLLKTEVRRIIATLTRVKKVGLPDIDEYVNVTEYYRYSKCLYGNFHVLSSRMPSS